MQIYFVSVWKMLFYIQSVQIFIVFIIITIIIWTHTIVSVNDIKDLKITLVDVDDWESIQNNGFICCK